MQAIQETQIPGSGRSPKVENGNPFQCSCLANPIAWRGTVHGVAKSRTWLSTHALIWNRAFCLLYFCYITLLSVYILVLYMETWSFRTLAIKCANHKAHLHFFDSMITKHLHMLGSPFRIGKKKNVLILLMQICWFTKARLLTCILYEYIEILILFIPLKLNSPQSCK